MSLLAGGREELLLAHKAQADLVVVFPKILPLFRGEIPQTAS